MMPRMSALASEGDIPGFNRLINKSFETLFFICFPVIIISILLAPYIIRVLTGSGFQGAVVPMQLIMPLVIVVGVAQILAVQVLMPLKKDRIILNASVLGSVTGIILNLMLVGRFGSTGTAMVLLITEFVITTYYIRVMSRAGIFSFPWKSLLKNFVVAMPYAAICIVAGLLFQRNYLVLSFAFVMSALYFIYASIRIFKNEEITRIWFILFRNISLRNVR
jgi:O-antigen/teichoic acid export membrane protein